MHMRMRGGKDEWEAARGVAWETGGVWGHREGGPGRLRRWGDWNAKAGEAGGQTSMRDTVGQVAARGGYTTSTHMYLQVILKILVDLDLYL